ncbi:MAG: glycerophosphoryl diester phosphodiesterase [Candidatus Methanocomedens sp.]|nr:MAG: glycerophosphoryl diester phosphodiesterase [ANME-2 cluster archaeon]
MHKKIIIAHRGASAYAKENSIESFRKAIEIGADMIEFDVRRTKDDIFTAYHDEFINDKTINELTYDEIKKNAGDILTVEEILRLTKGKIKLDVELKEEGYEGEIIELLLAYFKEDEFVTTSFNDTSLKAIKSRHPNLRVGLLLGKDKPKNLILTRFSELYPIKRAIQAEADFLAPHWKLLKLGFLERARKNHMPISVWTVNDEEKIRKFLNNDIIEAIITDKPDVAISLQKRITSPNSG